LEIEWILVIHNNCIFPYYGHSIKIVWIYYGFIGAAAASQCQSRTTTTDSPQLNLITIVPVYEGTELTSVAIVFYALIK
jgi:hypothetical protein